MTGRSYRRAESGQALLVLLIALGMVGAYFAIQLFGNGGESTRTIIDTNATLTEAKDAILGYVVQAPAYLPCPDRTTGANANDGVEDRVGTACAVPEGNLPWITLRITGLDAWGHRLHYRVDPAFANSNPALAIQSSGVTTGVLTINNENGAAAAGLPVVLLSYGKNGWGATSRSGGQIGLPPATHVNERENTDGIVNNLFFAYGPADQSAAGGEFDDIVTWLDIVTIRARMTQAGLP